MRQHKMAYIEAEKILINNNCLSSIITNEFNLKRLCEYKLIPLSVEENYCENIKPEIKIT
jgi:uncharacterized protein YacL